MGVGDKVAGWIGTLPKWQQDLARRVAGSPEASTDELDEALLVVKGALGVPTEAAAREPVPLSPGDLPRMHAGPVAKLKKFGLLRGVGLVVDDAQIDFCPDGLTIVFGANASGKSSYVRGLKSVCYSVDRDCPVYGNVYSPSAEKPSADVEYVLGSDRYQQRTPLRGDGVLRLPGLAVFDSACAELYVNRENVIQYIPVELLVLTRLAALQDRLRASVASERVQLMGYRPALDGIGEDTAVGSALRELRGDANDPNLAELAILDEESRARLGTLRAAVAAADAATANADAVAAQADATAAEELCQALETLALRTGAEATARLRQAVADDRTARDAMALANEQFAAGPLPGVGSEPWTILWSAARSFAEGAGAQFPPGEGDPCPLCLQEVGRGAAERMSHFEQHVKSEVHATATRTAGALEAALRDCEPGQVDTSRAAFLERLRAVSVEVAAGIDGYMERAVAHLTAMRTRPAEAVAMVGQPHAAIEELRAWAAGRAAHAAQLLSTTDEDELKTLRKELRELEAREALAARLDEFIAWRGHLSQAARLDGVHSALATNKITIKQRELTDVLLSGALAAALAEELKRLHCDHLPISIDMHTALAETTVELRLVTSQAVELAHIVSEGERRAVGLAFFLAELSTMADDAGIILDDPVSSLDDDRRQSIAERLIAEARRRQVIVFTHDLPFVADLQSQAESDGVELTVRGMWRLGNDVGRVDEDPPFKTMNLRQRVGLLKKRAQEWDAQPPPSGYDEAWHRVTQFYSDLRTSWERAVEERLFRGVVQRFQRAVKTQSLKEVVITGDLVDQVERGMTRSSMFVHDEPPSSLTPLPGRTELEADVACLTDFEKETRRG